MFAGLLIAVVAVSVFLGGKAMSVSRETARLREKIQQMREDLAAVEAVSADKQLQRQTGSLPATKELPGIIDDLGNLAERNAVAVSAIDLPAPAAEGRFQKQPVVITCESTFSAAGEFMGALAAYSRTPIEIHDFRMQAGGTPDKPVTSRLTLHVYLEGQDGG